MSYALYLDDDREPKTDRDWIVVRSYDAFKEIVKERGVPDVISLDHDLGTEKTGLDCAQWLSNFCIDGKHNMSQIEFNVHSANPVGAANIQQYWNFAVRYQQGDINDRA